MFDSKDRLTQAWLPKTRQLPRNRDVNISAVSEFRHLGLIPTDIIVTSVCCPCWFRIWQLNCQNNFLASGSAGGISMKIATKFNIVGSILVWYIHINTFLARAIIKLTVFHCRFATMSPEMREMEHGGCRIASPARAVRALFRLESWATRVGEVDRGASASSRMTGSAPRCVH